MDTPNLEEYFDVCYKLTKECGLLVSDAIVKVKNVSSKSCDIDLVTETDQEVERLLIGGLKQSFPTHKFIGEESVAAGIKCVLTDEPTWVIDPVDGTMNFVHGLPLVAISIGLLINKQPVLGIVYNPILDQMFTAKIGQGAFFNGNPMRVSGQTDLKKALICTEVGSSKDPAKLKVVLSNLTKLIGNVHGVRVYGTAAWAICMVATGAADVFCHLGLHCWDTAAGQLLITEAGGTLLDYGGRLSIQISQNSDSSFLKCKNGNGTLYVRSLGSAAMTMASVASGGVDAYYEYGLHAWDMAAGDIIIREAGGTVVDTSGGPFDLMSRRCVCASSPELAKDIAALLDQFELERD